MILLLTLVSGALGFVAGYILFARYGDDYIPLSDIFMGDEVRDGVLNSVLFLKPKILGSAGFMAFAGCVIAVLLEVTGNRKQGTGSSRRTEQSSLSGKGFYECKWCGFKSPAKQHFCEACGNDENGMLKEDYRMKAVNKKSKQ